MVLPLYGEISDSRYRLVDYVGGGYLLGASSGSAFHFTRGFRDSATGGGLAGGIRAVRTNVPGFAGRGAAGLGVFWAAESAMCLARDGRQDYWNSIAAGAVTFGLAGACRGAPAAALFALLGAASFAGLAGASWTLDSWQSRDCSQGRMEHGSPALAPCQTVGGDPIVDSMDNR